MEFEGSKESKLPQPSVAAAGKETIPKKGDNGVAVYAKVDMSKKANKVKTPDTAETPVDAGMLLLCCAA